MEMANERFPGKFDPDVGRADRRTTMLHLSILPLIAQYGVFIVALLILVGELGVPTGVPAELALLLTGAYAVHSLKGLVGAILLIGLADVVGTMALHMAARTGGASVLQRLMKRHESDEPSSLDRWRSKLGKNDIVMVAGIRMLPMVRMYITIAAGLFRMRKRDFILGATPAALVWVGVPVALGYAFRTNVSLLTDRYSSASQVILFASPLLGISIAAFFWLRANRSKFPMWRTKLVAKAQTEIVWIHSASTQVRRKVTRTHTTATGAITTVRISYLVSRTSLVAVILALMFVLNEMRPPLS
jgi:membrane protein DedA with SNARE-associated domain